MHCVRLPRSEPDDPISHSPDALNAAIEDWHRAFREACSENRECADRVTAVINALITWLAENPASARIYFGEAGAGDRPDLVLPVLTAKQRMTSRIVERVAPCGQPDHRTRIEFAVAVARQVVREELRREIVDHARLAHKLTHLTPLLVEPICAAHR